MSIKKYYTFLKVAECGSITKAAEALGHTQSGVTQLIHSLEEELQVSLLKRSRGGITLTQEGEALLPYIKEILQADDSLKKAAARFVQPANRTLVIGTFTSVAVNWLPELLKQYRVIDPSIRFELRDIRYNNIEESLSDESLDLCFVPLPLKVTCQTIPLLQDPLLAVLPTDHPLAGEAAFPVENFQTDTVLSLVDEINRDANGVWTANNIVPNIAYTTKDDYALIAMVEKGLGICIMPRLLLMGHDAGVRCMELAPKASRTLGIAFPPHKEIRPEALQFAHFIEQILKSNEKSDTL